MACESLYPGPQAMRTLEPAQRRAIFTAIPGMDVKGVDAYGPRATPYARVQQARSLAQRLKDAQAWPNTVLQHVKTGQPAQIV